MERSLRKFLVTILVVSLAVPGQSAQALDLFGFMDNIFSKKKKEVNIVEEQAIYQIHDSGVVIRPSNSQVPAKKSPIEFEDRVPQAPKAPVNQPPVGPAPVKTSPRAQNPYDSNSGKVPSQPPAVGRQQGGIVGSDILIKPEVYYKNHDANEPKPVWNDEQRVYWNDQITAYYDSYIANENFLSKLDKQSRVLETTPFYKKIPSNQPNIYILNKDFSEKKHRRFGKGHHTRARHSGIRWRLEPMILANFDIEKKYVNLTPYTGGVPDPDDPPVPNPPPAPTPQPPAPTPQPPAPTPQPPAPTPQPPAPTPQPPAPTPQPPAPTPQPPAPNPPPAPTPQPPAPTPQPPAPTPGPIPDPDDPPIPDPTDEPPIPSSQFKSTGKKVIGRIVLQPAGQTPAGYEMNLKKTVDFGVGASAQASASMGNPVLWALQKSPFYVGGLAHISTVSSITRNVGNTSDKDVGIMQPTAKNIKLWSVGDSISCGLTGGFLFTVGANYYTVGASFTYVNDVGLKDGGAEHVVTKIGDQKVMVEVVNLVVNSASVNVMGGIVTHSVALKNKIEKVKKTYFFDLANPTGARAFNAIMTGNYADAQYIATRQLSPAVSIVDKDSSVNRLASGDYMRTWYIGVPFLYWSKLTAQTSTDGYLEDYVNDRGTLYFQAIYQEHKNRRIVTDHKNMARAFYSGAEISETSAPKGEREQDYYGRFLWNYQDESTSRDDLREKIDRLVYIDTGLEELDVEERLLPSKLNYANVEMIMDLNRAATDILVGHVENGMGDYQRAAQKALDTYFNAVYMGNEDYYMGSEDRDWCYVKEKHLYRGIYVTDGQEGESIRSAKVKCREIATAQTMDTVRKMYQIITAMVLIKDSETESDKKALAKMYNKLGQLMMTSRFTVRMVYNLLAAETNLGDFVRYIVNGEKMANLTVYFPSGKIAQPLNSLQK